MSRANGRRKRAIEGLAAALQECFDASSELAEQRMEKRNESRFEQVDDRFRQVDARFEQVDARFGQVDARFDKQDDTLRMIWKQCGGKPDQRLPIDD